MPDNSPFWEDQRSKAARNSYSAGLRSLSTSFQSDAPSTAILVISMLSLKSSAGVTMPMIIPTA
jgi:hypothetical protein